MISIGIHIGRSSVCFAGLSLKGGKPELHFIEEKVFEDSDSEREKLLLISSQIKSIEEKQKGQSLRFCYGLSQNLVTSFLVETPFKEKFKILKTLPFEIEDKTPFRSNQIFFDARICKIKNKNHSSALCFVTPEDNVNQFLEFNNPLKRSPYLLSCEGSALANLLESWNQPLSQIQNPMKTPLYIYLGEGNSQLLFYKEGYLSHISVLDWTVTSVVREMKKLYKLTMQKAWDEFFEKAFILTSSKGWTKEQIFFSNLVKTQVGLLIPKLRLLKMSLEIEQKTSISEAVLFGPGSGIKNLTAFLTEQISANVSRLKTLKNCPDFKSIDSSLAHIAIGLALEGLKNFPYQGLNFLQSMQKESISLYPKKWKRAVLIFFLCFIVWTAYSFVRKQESYKNLGKIQEIFTSYGKKIALMTENQINTESIKSFLEKEKTKLKSEQIVQEKLNQPNPMDHLQLISQKLGSANQWNLSIRYLHLEGQAVEIRGLVNSSALENFKSKLSSLAEGSIKEQPVSFSPEELKVNSSIESRKMDSEQTKDKPPGQQKGKSSSVFKSEERSFFSYSFQLKEEL